MVCYLEIEIQMCNLLMDVRLTLRWFGLFLVFVIAFWFFSRLWEVRVFYVEQDVLHVKISI